MRYSAGFRKYPWQDPPISPRLSSRGVSGSHFTAEVSDGPDEAVRERDFWRPLQ